MRKEEIMKKTELNDSYKTDFRYPQASGLETAPPDASRSRAWIEISRSALRHNTAYLQSLLPKHCALMPVVKANAYGHGAVLVARELNTMGIHSFCVACVSEGVALRRQQIAGEILVLGYTHPDQFPLLDQYALTQTVVDQDHALALNAYACRASRPGPLCPNTDEKGKPDRSPLPVHIAVDTGMHRLGEPAEHLSRIREIFSLPGLRITGLYSHLAAAGGTDPASRDYTLEQISTFYRLTARLGIRGNPVTDSSGRHCPPPRLHIQASYGILRYPMPDMDCARPGIALYGLLSSAADMGPYADKLHPVLSLRARVAAIHQLSPGQSAGYDMAYTAARPTTVATVAIGYADGLPRILSEGRGTVLLHGRQAPVVGRICMDQLLADVTSIPQTRPGDIATLIGHDGQESVSAADLADACGTITNELLCCLGPRLERLLL